MSSLILYCYLLFNRLYYYYINCFPPWNLNALFIYYMFKNATRWIATDVNKANIRKSVDWSVITHREPSTQKVNKIHGQGQFTSLFKCSRSRNPYLQMTTRLKTQTKTQNKHPPLSLFHKLKTTPSGSNTEGWVEGEDGSHGHTYAMVLETTMATRCPVYC